MDAPLIVRGEASAQSEGKLSQVGNCKQIKRESPASSMKKQEEERESVERAMHESSAVRQVKG